MTAEVSRRPAEESPIFRAMRGWQPALVLMKANRLGVFQAIGEEKLPAWEIAEKCQAHPRSMALLLNACVALRFLRKEGNLYVNPPEALELLIPGKPTYIGDMLKHSEDTMAAWTQLAESVRTNQPAPTARARPPDPEVIRNFILAMHNRALVTGQVLADNLDLSGRHQLFDAGGGPGTYSIFLARKYPTLKAIVFDLPQPIEIAREIIASFGLQERVTTRVGNYFKDDLGQGNDAVLLSAILHSMGPERCKLLLRKSFQSLVKGGIVVVQEGLISADGTSPVSAALFSLNMLVQTGEGQSWSGEEIVAWMQETGFINPFVKTLPPPAWGQSLVIATKP